MAGVAGTSRHAVGSEGRCRVFVELGGGFVRIRRCLFGVHNLVA